MNRLLAAAGLSILILVGGLAAVSRDADAQAPTAQPRFVNAQVESRAAGPGLSRVFSEALGVRRTAGWIGYSVAGVPGEHHLCESQYPSRVYLEGRPSSGDRDEGTAGNDEGSRDIAILFRAEVGKVQKVRVFGTDCELEAGGLPVTWLTAVSATDSVALLRGFVVGDTAPTGGSELNRRVSREASVSRLGESALTAMALHADPSALHALQAFAADAQPNAIRKRAAFWLGAARGDEGFETLRRLLASEPDAAFRRELVFPISISRRADAVDLLLRVAREDGSPEVRKQAMFWLGQKAGQRAARALGDAIENDPDTAVKRQAVFGLSRMPNGEGVPRLIEVARANRNPEVRRQAMFWLGQSNDPRALAFLEEVLKR